MSIVPNKEPLQIPPLRKRNLVACVFGMKGCGKSFLVKDTIIDYNRIITIDNIGEYHELEIVNGFDNCVRRITQASRESEFRIACRAESVEHDLQLIRLAGTMQSFLLVVEETSKYVSSAGMPEPIESLIRYGRHRDISQIYISRRPSEINRELTANADVIVTFRTQEPRDIAYMRSFMGERAYNLPRLSEYECAVVWNGSDMLPLSIMERMPEDG